MIEEPYRWVEAIANRREYIEHQLAGGSPIACVGYAGGILLLTISRERQKIFEIYDRIAMGAIGHPGDIERLRMTAIEVTSTEGFTRSAQDVSLRRLAAYSLSPALKTAFEQVYGAPYLARMIFAELGKGSEPNLFVRIDYDGSIRSNGGALLREAEDFGVLSGSQAGTAAMENFLRAKKLSKATLQEAFSIALEAWGVGSLAAKEESNSSGLPSQEQIKVHLTGQLDSAVIEAAVMENGGHSSIAYRSLSREEIAGFQKTSLS